MKISSVYGWDPQCFLQGGLKLSCIGASRPEDASVGVSWSNLSGWYLRARHDNDDRNLKQLVEWETRRAWQRQKNMAMQPKTENKGRCLTFILRSNFWRSGLGFILNFNASRANRSQIKPAGCAVHGNLVEWWGPWRAFFVQGERRDATQLT